MKLLTSVILFAVCLIPILINGQHTYKRYSIPGFLQLNDTLFISTTEVDIREYARFLAV